MKQRAEHTPTPWEVCSVDRIEDSNGLTVAETYITATPGNCQANADFIVTACNNHDRLVEALESVLEIACYEDNKRIVNDAERVLAQAKGK